MSESLDSQFVDRGLIEPATIDLWDSQDEVSATSESESLVQYPCVIIDGVYLKEEVLFLKERVGGPENAIPMYVLFNGEPQEVGTFSVGIKSLLFLQYMNYQGTLFKSQDAKLDLLDCDNYYLFITI